MTFAIMALLFGGFAFNANAQKPADKTSDAQTVEAKATGKNDTKADENASKTKTKNWDKVLKDYEKAVEQCITLYNASQDKENLTKYDPKKFDKWLTKAENLKSQLEKAKDELNRTQVDRFNKATEKLAKVYAKG